MDVCMIVHAYYLKDARVRMYAEFLTREGHHVDVICLRETGEKPQGTHSGVRVCRIDLSRKRGGKFSYIQEYFLSFFKYLYLINRLTLNGKRYDLIHVHNFPNFLVFAAAVQKLMGAKIVLDVHDPMPELFSSKYQISLNHPLIRVLYWEERFSSMFADHLITANHFFKDLLVRRGCPIKKVEVIMNSPGQEFFQSHSHPSRPPNQKKEFNILYIGTLAERYGIETALKAVAIIRKSGSIPNLRFKIIPKIQNEGPYVDQLLALVKQLGLENCFEFLNSVPNEKMPEVIQAADVSVFTPSPDVHMDIALSLKIPEVIAMGCPLVTSRLPVLEKYFGEAEIFMFEPGNIKDCAARLIEVYQHPEEAERRTEKALEALKKISRPKQTSIYLCLIQNLVTGLLGYQEATSFRMRLKKHLRRWVAILTCLTGLSLFWNRLLANQMIRILTYHGIENSPTNSYSVSKKNFDQQMEYLKKHFNVISLNQLVSLRESKTRIPPNTVIITFDDGYKNFFEHAYPILKKYQLHATCFVITSKINNDDRERFMGWDQVQEISKEGLVTIGSHSVSHQSLPRLKFTDQDREIQESKQTIEKNIGEPVNFFSYPYGVKQDFDNQSAQRISSSGYKLACTSINGVNSAKANPYQLKRTKIEWGDNLGTFKRILHGGLDVWWVVDYFLGFLQNRKEVAFESK